jgi:cyanophycinase
MTNATFTLFGLLSLLTACAPTPEPVSTTVAPTKANARLTRWLVGDAADVSRTTTGGTVLMGGGTDVDAAIRWMIQKAGGGDFVVLRASGSDGYNPYIFSELGGVNSCETILIDSRNAANDAGVETTIRNAEAVFIAGGDQANYVNFWKDTRVEDALNYLRNTKKVPIGGTSAGCAIQGRTYFSALNGTITTAQALANPYSRLLTLGRNDFLNNPYLADLITDTHFNNPDRRGRLLTFMARMSKDYGVVPRGVGVDEKTAVCIDENGSSKVFGTGTAFFLQQNGSSNVPERCVSGQSLDWYRGRVAVRVYKINGTATGTGAFNFSTWSGSGGTSQYYYVDKGTLGVN